MFNTRKKFVLTALFLSFMPTVNATSFFDKYMIDPDDGMLDASRYLSQVPLGFLPVPTIITEPATGNGLAVVGIPKALRAKRPKKARRPQTPPFIRI